MAFDSLILLIISPMYFVCVIYGVKDNSIPHNYVHGVHTIFFFVKVVRLEAFLCILSFLLFSVHTQWIEYNIRITFASIQTFNHIGLSYLCVHYNFNVLFFQ